MFITTFTSTCHLSLSCTRSIQSNFSNTRQQFIVGDKEQELEHKVKDCVQAATTQTLKQCIEEVKTVCTAEWGKTAQFNPYFTAD
jgi:hypothetical protein